MWVGVQLGVESLGGDLVDRTAGATHMGGPPRRDYRRARIVLPEGLHQAVHHEQQNHRERHARGDGCRLQRLQTAREQQHTGDETFTQPPEDAEPLRRMRIAALLLIVPDASSLPRRSTRPVLGQGRPRLNPCDFRWPETSWYLSPAQD
jgi:hypothetical protein